MFLKIGFGKLLIFCLFSKVIWSNTEVKSWLKIYGLKNIKQESIYWRRNTYCELPLTSHNRDCTFLETYWNWQFAVV